MGSLEEILAVELAHPVLGRLFGDLLGPLTPGELARAVEALVAPAHGPVARGLFAAISVGAVFGVETAAGERLVLKIYPRSLPHAHLATAHAVQARLAALAFPVPRLRGGLLAMPSGLFASIADFVDGDEEGGHDPRIITELGGALARCAQLSEQEGFPLLAAAVPSRGRLWPVPHKSTIRLAQTARGAGFLRDRAVRARTALAEARALRPRLAHLDWGVKNARFRAKKLVAVFDWDSLGSAVEAVTAGKAAAQFTAHWDIPTKITPSPEEASAFMHAYEAARGRRFTALERRVAAAAADQIIAVIARQEWGEGVRGEANTYVELCRELGDRPLLSF